MITYYGDGKGRWIKVVWATQCSEKIMMAGRCQGVEGQCGKECWCYAEDGSYCYSVNGDLEPHEIAGGSIPPDHKDWIHPKKKQKDRYLSHRTETEVTDPDEIERLNRGEINDGESINKPLDMSELSDEMREDLEERLRSYDESKSKSKKKPWWRIF
jgi:tRNA (cmo5U34)-methyltransferase